uniref:Uncharacterized protein n=1 Tax=Arundo donax TaxID=35708 RepID=A0A0A9SLW0_ARUDO
MSSLSLTAVRPGSRRFLASLTASSSAHLRPRSTTFSVGLVLLPSSSTSRTAHHSSP